MFKFNVRICLSSLRSSNCDEAVSGTYLRTSFPYKDGVEIQLSTAKFLKM